jgi:glycogen operon protein
MLDYVRGLIDLRRGHPVFRRQRFFQGRPIKGIGVKDITWLTSAGEEMSDQEWRENQANCLGILLVGAGLEGCDARGCRIQDDDFLLFINAHHEAIPFRVPNHRAEARWRVVIDTARPDGGPEAAREYPPGDEYPLQARSLALLIRENPPRQT